MSLRSRLDKLETLAPAPPVSDPWWDTWLWFRALTFATLEGGDFAEALALVKQRVAANEPHVFPGRGPIIRNGHDVRLWLMTQTVWQALHGFPAAAKALEDALQRSTQERAAVE